jgi:gas vesicle protein
MAMDDSNSGVEFALGFSLGLVAGVLATILLTPQSGDRTRQGLKQTTLEETDSLGGRIMHILEDEAERLARRLGEELLDVARSFVERQQAELRTGMDGNGRGRYHQA